MEIIQILIIIFALFAWSRSLLRWQDKSLNGKELIFWSLVWVAVIVVAIVPQSVGFLRVLGIGSAFNTLAILSILLLFYLIFRMYVKIDKMEQEITLLVREIAKK